MHPLSNNRSDERFGKSNLMPHIRKAAILIVSFGITASLIGLAAPATAETADPVPTTSIIRPAVTETAAAYTGESPTAPSVKESPVAPESQPAVDAAESAAMGGVVFDDLNGNELLDAGESGIAGVKTLPLGQAGGIALDSNGAPVLEQTTAADGKYRFANLVPGAYTIRYQLPAGYVFGGIRDALDSRYDGVERPLQVNAGDDFPTINRQVVGSASVSGLTFDDKNRNGIRDLGEGGVLNVVVSLQNSDGTSATDLNGDEISSRYPNDDGSYEFGDLRPGAYRVVFQAPLGKIFTESKVGADPTRDSDAIRDLKTWYTYGVAAAPVSLASGSALTSIDAGLIDEVSEKKVEISGTAFEDLKGDGVWELADPGVPGVKVILLDDSLVPIPGRETVTNAEGGYLFYDMPEGIYRVKFIQPAGYDAKFTAPNPDGVTKAYDLREAGGVKKVDAGLTKVILPVSNVGKTLNGAGELANTGVSGAVTGLVLGGGLLLAGAASVYFARRRREA